MKQLHSFAIVLLGVCLLLLSNLFSTSQAETRFQLKSPQGNEVSLSVINQKRESDSIVLYTNEYGASTRTNPYGVEIAATPVPGMGNQYQVQSVTSVFVCQQSSDLSKCGNMSIPKNGVVLSATGNKRDLLLSQFQSGAVFELNSLLTYESRIPLSGTNPTAESNPSGSGFPGYRGGGQMLVYNCYYGQPTTGTNEFGYEVTVRNGRVIAQEGANSTIPPEDGGFVLSGHGKAREWLLKNAPIGSRVDVIDGSVVSVIDKDTYLYQLDEMVSKINRFKNGNLSPTLQQRVEVLRHNALQMSNEAVAREALALKQELTPILWASYPSVSQTTSRAVWHRPSEGSIDEIRQSLDLLKNAGINTIFLETYLHGDPIFPSSTFKEFGIPQKLPFQLKEPNRDLMQVWLEEAHKRGIKVHVWFQTFYAGNVQYDKSKGSILSKYPQWANVQRSAVSKAELPPSTLEAGSYFLDPANQEAQGFVMQLIDEIVTRYPIDGFQLDYIRYPSSFPPDRFSYVATTWGYSSMARSVFQAKTGVDPVDLNPEEQPELWAEWNDFKTSQIDRFVRRAREIVKTKRPDIPMSVAVFPKPEDALVRKHQNWVSWAQNGWVDFIAPMTLTSSLDTIAQDTRSVRQYANLPIITGVFGPFNGSTPSEVLDQVWAAFSAGANGIALFDTAHLTQKMAEALRMGLFKFNNNQ